MAIFATIVFGLKLLEAMRDLIGLKLFGFDLSIGFSKLKGLV
jgi:hypothetical protein